MIWCLCFYVITIQQPSCYDVSTTVQDTEANAKEREQIDDSVRYQISNIFLLSPSCRFWYKANIFVSFGKVKSCFARDVLSTQTTWLDSYFVLSLSTQWLIPLLVGLTGTRDWMLFRHLFTIIFKSNLHTQKLVDDFFITPYGRAEGQLFTAKSVTNCVHTVL